MAASFGAFLNSPIGPRTTHFWGPVANWGFVMLNVHLFSIIHEVRMDGTASQLSTSSMPCLKRVSAALSIFPLGKGYLQQKKDEAASASE